MAKRKAKRHHRQHVDWQKCGPEMHYKVSTFFASFVQFESNKTHICSPATPLRVGVATAWPLPAQLSSLNPAFARAQRYMYTAAHKSHSAVRRDLPTKFDPKLHLASS